MGTLPQTITHLYTITAICITLLFLELFLSFRTLFKFLLTTFKTSPTSLLQLIELKVPTTLFKLQPLSHNSASYVSDCLVCLCDFEDGDQIRKLKCKHTFHKECVDRWLEQEFATCPLCRREVVPKEEAGRFRRREEVGYEQYDGSGEELIFLLSALQGNNLHRLL